MILLGIILFTILWLTDIDIRRQKLEKLHFPTGVLISYAATGDECINKYIKIATTSVNGNYL